MQIKENRNLLLFLLALINFTHIVDSMLIMPLGDIFISEFSMSSVQYSLLVSGYAAAATISGFIGIFLLDRYSRKRALLFIYLGFALGTILCSLTKSFEVLLLLRIITGFFGGIIGALVLSIVSDLFEFRERGKAMGYLFTAFSAASAFGVPLGIYLADIANWQLPFIIIGGCGLLVACIIWWIFPLLDEHLIVQSKRINPITIIQTILRDRNQIDALIAGFFLVLAHFMIIPFISPYIIRNVGLTQQEVALQFFLGGFATLFSAPLIGRLTDQKGVMPVFLVVLFISFIPTILITNMPEVPIWVALTCTTLFFVFASGRMISPNTLISAAAPMQNRGSFMSLKSSLQQGAIALASVISGQIIYIDPDTNLFKNYPYVGVLSIVFGLITIYWIRKIRVVDGN